MSELEPDLHEVVVRRLVWVSHQTEPSHGDVGIIGAEAGQCLDSVVLALDARGTGHRLRVELLADLVHDTSG